MTLQFDDFGYLLPYEVIPMDLATFERTFVLDAERERLFQALLNLVLDLKNLGAGAFYIWADGSFVTKKRVPRDIDLVVFISLPAFNRIDTQLERLRATFESSLDIFIEPDYPEEHPKYSETVRAFFKWKELFGYDRNNKRKGIIELRF